jgi:glycine/D-amino acid oxidase-like deaminating enzyme/nitrite reductase/ring-hydroxylating ferredoxin subunit
VGDFHRGNDGEPTEDPWLQAEAWKGGHTVKLRRHESALARRWGRVISIVVKPQDGQTRSAWVVVASPRTYPRLDADATADVCIVGAGISGLTTAYLLAREDRSVIVVDAGPVGDGQTGRTSAHLASAIDDRFFEIRQMHGENAARICYDSHASAIDQIEEICNREKIDCDFARINGYLVLAPGEDPKLLDRELAAAELAGFDGVARLDRADVEGFTGGPCLRFPRQGRFHPLKYLDGLCRAIETMGGKIYCGNHVTAVEGAELDKNEMCSAKTKQGPVIRSRAIVVATNTPAPIADWTGIYTKQSAYRTYMLGVRVPRGSVSDALYWDTLDPYHYVRIDSASGDDDHDTLLVGGADHKTGQFEPTSAPFADLESWTRRHFPTAGAVTFRWSGQVQEPDDSIAFIGRAPTAKPNVHVITGDSGMGLTHGTLGAMLVRDQILQRANPWEWLYDPSRKMTASIGEFIRENVNVVTKYADYLTGGDVTNVEQIQPGSGAVVREGLGKVAAYRDASGELHKCSAVCTHMGCVVQWNHVEGTWDCPCHGSRFGPVGQVIIGPAVDDLKPREPAG